MIFEMNIDGNGFVTDFCLAPLPLCQVKVIHYEKVDFRLLHSPW